jgi:hypothetical protein
MSKRIGILGGGQLAMMMTEAAHRLGHDVFVKFLLYYIIKFLLYYIIKFLLYYNNE